MNDINKLRLPDDWAEDYESPITLAFQEIANKITEERDDRIVARLAQSLSETIKDPKFVELCEEAKRLEVEDHEDRADNTI